MKELWKLLRYDMPYVVFGSLAGVGLISVIVVLVKVLAVR